MSIFENPEFKDQTDICLKKPCLNRPFINKYCLIHYYELENTKHEQEYKQEDKQDAFTLDKFLSYEKECYKGIKSIVEGFMVRLEKLIELNRPILNKTEIKTIFLNIKDILDLNYRFHTALKRLKQEQKLMTPEFTTVTSRFVPFLRIYTTYVHGYDDSIKLISNIKSKKDSFVDFLELCESCEKNKLVDLLKMPVKQIPHYLVLFREMYNTINPRHPMASGIKKTLQYIENIVNDIKTSFDEKESRLRVIEIQAHIEYNPPLVIPSRRYVRDGMLSKKYSEPEFRFLGQFKKHWFFLFNDIIIYTSMPNSKGYCKLKRALPLTNMTINDIPKPSDTGLVGFELVNTVKTISVFAVSQEEKNSWVKSLEENINKLKNNKPNWTESSTSLSIISISPPSFPFQKVPNIVSNDYNSINDTSIFGKPK